MIDSPPSRRQILAGLATAPLLPTVVSSQTSNPDVIVIGAGASGIAAARRLIASGKTVQVIEAADRIGGRAYTETDTFGVPYDQGCAWLQGPDDLPHLQAAKDLGFHLHDHDTAHDALFVEGRRASHKEQRQYDRAYARLYQALTTDADVAGASLASLDQPMDAVAQTWTGPLDFGVDLTDLSTADWNVYPDYDVNYLVREGLGSLVAHLGRALPVSLNTRATAVDWSGQGVRVETTQGMLEAKAVIVTVSTGVLASGAIRFAPELPADKQQAIADVPMGLLTKIALQFDGERFDLQENNFLTYAIPNELPAEACYFLTFPTGHDIAVGFVGGQFGWAMADAGPDAAVDFALNEFSKAVGSNAQRHFIKGHMSGWAKDRLTLGAYSAAQPGKAASRTVLAEPLGDRVFFAGEAVAGPYIALLSGAHMSGDSVARDVAAQLGGAEGCGACDARHHNLQKEKP
ncbi:flavin monoamine oxidase family protein [Roseobacter weihaiensis]|uniref:flavin monoamine oxidase family protein n=1 Tax=Roseobacter weihaiensis TaxID=2763262 RepID=UPI001D0A9502|nr:NAD(P)/FAD-dependent oxidoreductase [Roseobacter sp. H9]